MYGHYVLQGNLEHLLGPVEETWNLEKICGFKSRRKQRKERRLKSCQFDVTENDRKRTDQAFRKMTQTEKQGGRYVMRSREMPKCANAEIK